MKRIPSLDGLRAISILLVVLGHLADRHYISAPFWSHYSNTGVRIFFVISGYLITQILLVEQQRASKLNLGKFYLRRAFRILPAALVFVTVMTVVKWQQLHWYQAATALLYMANLGIAAPWFFGHLWSLSVEEQFYLFWPGVLKRFRRHAVGILVAIVIAVPCFSSLLYHWRGSQAWSFSFPAVADALAAGCLLAILAKRIPRIPSYVALAMVATVFLVPFFEPNSASRTLLQLFLLRPLQHFSIAGLILRVVQKPPRLLNMAPMCWVGRISYSLYLWQQPFCCAPLGSSPHLPVLGLVCACLSYYCVEQPMLRLRQNLGKRNPLKLRQRELEVSATAA